MGKMIIGIHGLSNKPAREEHQQYWLQSMQDGLSKVGNFSLSADQFKLAHWADLMYAKPDSITEPYTKPETDEIDDDSNKILDIGRELLSNYIGKKGDQIENELNNKQLDVIRNDIRGLVAKDLAEYYDDNSEIKFTGKAGTQTKTALRSVLSELIKQHKNDELMIIGHSMGSIIAYDVLRSLKNSSFLVSQFVTIGSPLGLSNVKAKILEEWGDKAGPFVPETITGSWINFSDRKDFVCADLSLGDDYKPSNNVSVKDILVSNGYCFTTKEGKKKHNHHKSYGYLRTKPFAEHLKAFLSS